MKKIFREIHLCLSVPFGLIITIICFSGAVLVFETEIMEICFPSRYFAKEIKEQTIPLEQLIERVNWQLPDTLSVANVYISADTEKNYRMGFSGRNRLSVYVDPYSGNVVDLYNPQGNFFSVMRQLHRWLLDDFKHDGSFSVGKTTVGTATLFFVFALISGLLLWLPKSKKLFFRSLKIKLKSGWRRFFYDLHVALGIYSALLLLALALTGLTWSFAWYRNGFYAAFGAESPDVARREMPSTQVSSSGKNRNESSRNNRDVRRNEFSVEINFTQWQKVIDDIKEQRLDFNTLSISDGQVSVSSSSFGNVRASDNYIFDARTGKITEIDFYRDRGKEQKLRGWIFSVHVGSWGGILTRILTFLAALFGASLPLTGYYLWIKRLVAKRKNKKRKFLSSFS
jgi:uncharacterized iron-regulated membrane protein